MNFDIEEYTKEDLWVALLYYVNHVGELEGVSFIRDYYNGPAWAKTWQILNEVENISNLVYRSFEKTEDQFKELFFEDRQN